MCCFQCGKVNKFESDSQPLGKPVPFSGAVSSVAKLINLKAIHNSSSSVRYMLSAVSSVAKLINLKAIHNIFLAVALVQLAVSSVAKLINLKAIHNGN